jgi:hypothetical protein
MPATFVAQHEVTSAAIFREGIDMHRLVHALVLAAALIALAPLSSRAEEAASAFDPSVRAELREPVVLASKDGVLEVRLTAKQG